MLPEQRWEGTEIKIKRHSNMCGSRELFLFLFSDLSDDIGHGRMRGEDQGGTTEGEKTLEIKMEGRARRMYPKEQSTPVGCVHFCTRVWRAAPHEQTELPDTLCFNSSTASTWFGVWVLPVALCNVSVITFQQPHGSGFGQHSRPLLSGERSHCRKTAAEERVNRERSSCRVCTISIQKCRESQWISVSE